MANETTKNLIPQSERTKDEQREIARMGGIASGKARREKQKTQQILADIVSIKNKDLAMFQKLATKLGLDGDISIHEVFTLTCLLNSVKSGNLGDLERLSKLLGEDNAKEQNNGILDELTEYLKNE
ncbi:KGG domain-containing protein [Ruminococcus sp.]|uniref:KGG domain-containing protein n=1 Tax=Ruminococcus sp. TaxID=41978 RepID=UPI00261DC73E|nr:KGG domain-containing protein [Ruminococcus sp.]MDD6990185.1 KGG domain-containing protein [Ruminococcus sp.]MDY6202895.1 KGG domain-containing protein [Ruminococcus sp.]